jgi:uncharacterized delta-60 repeat protein
MKIYLSRYFLLRLSRWRLGAVICVVLFGQLSGASRAAPGQLDPTFGTGGIAIGSQGSFSAVGSSAIVQPDGLIVVAGACTDAQTTRFCLARYSASGAIDVSFGINGQSQINAGDIGSQTFSVALQSDGKIIAGGMCLNIDFTVGFCLVRLLESGLLDTTFAANGISRTLDMAGSSWITSLRVLSNGKILAAGRCSAEPPSNAVQLCVVRYLESGAIDMNFGRNGRAILGLNVSTFGTALAVAPNGNILVAGNCTGPTTLNNFCVSRFSANGTLDQEFGSAGLSITSMGEDGFESALSIALTQDGRIVLGGYCSVASRISFCFARYRTDGNLDTNFGSAGKVVTQVGVLGGARSVAIQSDGKIVAAGDCNASTNQSTDFCLVRLDSSGAVDTSFGVFGRVIAPIGSGEDRGRSMVLLPSGDFILVGECKVGASTMFCLAKFQGGPYPTKACGLDLDANLVTSPDSDAPLLIRYLLGYRGVALTADALGLNPTRTGQALEDHLASLNLDADGDGQALAMTDGLLMLRAMLGLTGDALTAGATNAAHPNVRNAQQILTSIEQTHGVACLP